MAFIQFGKKEIEALEKENSHLRNELKKAKALGEDLNALIVRKNLQIIEYENLMAKLKEKIRDIEKIKDEKEILDNILSKSSRQSKATIQNINMIKTLKEEGQSFRAIAKALSEATGNHYAHSTVRYLYNKYIK